MNGYKFLFWCMVFSIYLFFMWFCLPSIGMEGLEEKGIEIGYLSAVIQSHVATIIFGLFVLFFVWVANKAGIYG